MENSPQSIFWSEYTRPAIQIEKIRLRRFQFRIGDP